MPPCRRWRRWERGCGTARAHGETPHGPRFSDNLPPFTGHKRGAILPIRLISSVGVAAVAAALGFAAPALASSVHFQTGAGNRSPGAHIKNNRFMAGYETTASSTNAMSVTTTIVVPTVKNCRTTRKVIIPFVSAEASSTNAAVGLDIHCRNGKVINFPIFDVNGHNKANASAHAHPGDKVVLRLSWNSSRLLLAVVDKTRPSVTRKLSGVGSSSFSDPDIADSVIGGSEPFPVPDFGKINFSESKINGRGLGLAPGLTRDNLVNMSDVLQIKTGPIRSDKESFTTTFKHS